MKYLLAVLLLCGVGCQTLQFDKGIIVLTDTTEFVQNGVTYTMWSGVADTKEVVFGLVKESDDQLQAGDIIVARARKSDTAWTYVRRLNANR